MRKYSDLDEKIAGTQHIPPQAIETEQSVLGAALLDAKAATQIFATLGDTREIVTPFYRDAHTEIYEAMIVLYEQSQPTDILQLTNILRTRGTLEKIGGTAYLVELTQKVVTTANVEYHCRIILQKFMSRELIRDCEVAKLEAFTEHRDIADILIDHSTNVFRITEIFIKKSSVAAGQHLTGVMTTIPKIQRGEVEATGILSGLSDLNEITGGWKKTDLIILAARPSQGKTALAMQEGKDVATGILGRPPLPVMIFSLEMGAEQLIYRMLANESGISAQRMQRKRGLRNEEWLLIDQAAKRMNNIPLFIDDTPALTPLELRARCRMQKSQSGLSLVIVDYLQLLEAGKSFDSREREISYISRSLKALAKELDVPVIALSQLNREVENRTGHKRPNLSNLRESGAIEADADIVLFLYRPETYGIETFEDGSQTKGVAEVIIGKHRNGPIGTVRTSFNGEAGIFRDLTVREEYA